MNDNVKSLLFALAFDFFILLTALGVWLFYIRKARGDTFKPNPSLHSSRSNRSSYGGRIGGSICRSENGASESTGRRRSILFRSDAEVTREPLRRRCLAAFYRLICPTRFVKSKSWIAQLWNWEIDQYLSADCYFYLLFQRRLAQMFFLIACLSGLIGFPTIYSATRYEQTADGPRPKNFIERFVILNVPFTDFRRLWILYVLTWLIEAVALSVGLQFFWTARKGKAYRGVQNRNAANTYTVALYGLDRSMTQSQPIRNRLRRHFLQHEVLAVHLVLDYSRALKAQKVFNSATDRLVRWEAKVKRKLEKKLAKAEGKAGKPSPNIVQKCFGFAMEPSDAYSASFSSSSGLDPSDQPISPLMFDIASDLSEALIQPGDDSSAILDTTPQHLRGDSPQPVFPADDFASKSCPSLDSHDRDFTYSLGSPPAGDSQNPSMFPCLTPAATSDVVSSQSPLASVVNVVHDTEGKGKERLSVITGKRASAGNARDAHDEADIYYNMKARVRERITHTPASHRLSSARASALRSHSAEYVLRHAAMSGIWEVCEEPSLPVHLRERYEKFLARHKGKKHHSGKACRAKCCTKICPLFRPSTAMRNSRSHMGKSAKTEDRSSQGLPSTASARPSIELDKNGSHSDSDRLSTLGTQSRELKMFAVPRRPPDERFANPSTRDYRPANRASLSGSLDIEKSLKEHTPLTNAVKFSVDGPNRISRAPRKAFDEEPFGSDGERSIVNSSPSSSSNQSATTIRQGDNELKPDPELSKSKKLEEKLFTAFAKVSYARSKPVTQNCGMAFVTFAQKNAVKFCLTHDLSSPSCPIFRTLEDDENVACPICKTDMSVNFCKCNRWPSWWKLREAPSPEDILWENLQVRASVRAIRAVSVYLVIFLVAFILTSSAALTNALTPLADQVENALNKASFLRFSLTGWLAPFLLYLITAILLPFLVSWGAETTRFSRYTSKARAVLYGNVNFMVLTSLIFPILSTSSLEYAAQWVFNTKVTGTTSVFNRIIAFHLSILMRILPTY